MLPKKEGSSWLRLNQKGGRCADDLIQWYCAFSKIDVNEQQKSKH